MNADTNNKVALLWVRELGERIGYGRTMQFAEQLWNEKHPGEAHASYCCTAFLVRCPACLDDSPCDWCCGAKRVTERVAQAIPKKTVDAEVECTVGQLRQQSALCDADRRVVLVMKDPEEEKMTATPYRVVRCYPDTTNEHGTFSSTFKLEIER